ncbi:tail fiber domain-containing protein [uncultured Maritimibacter sp.]|uniref:tail fiber domain-containing protein n=1 Tax=uncultured Maritimibacter sp. TaxID=991866 RepID=UPI002592790A|nr:tail fiber domain-containing protein [uncultured Maritimibacter sp.]
MTSYTTQPASRSRIIEVVKRGQKGADGNPGLLGVAIKAANADLTEDERAYAIRCTAAITLTLDEISNLTAGWSCIVDATNGDVTVETSGSDTIDGASSITILGDRAAYIYTDGTNFYSTPFGEAGATLYVDIGGATGGGAVGRIDSSGDDLRINPTNGAGGYDTANQFWFDYSAGYWKFEGALQVPDDTLTANAVRASSSGDASTSSTTHGFQVGPTSGPNMILDPNEIMARDNGSLADLYLNEGGWIKANGAFRWAQNSSDDPAVDRVDGLAIASSGQLSIHRDASLSFKLGRDGDGLIAYWYRSGVNVGNINVASGTTNYSTASDHRLKERVQPLSGATELIMALRPYTFAFKTDPDITHMGFLAHEAQQHFPRAVTGEKDGEEMQSVDLSKFVPALVAAFQEAQREIEDLKAQVASLLP